MISHVPAGQGNPYRVEPDQRFPYFVAVGQECEIRCSTPSSVTECILEFRVNEEVSRRQMDCLGAATPTDYNEFSKPAVAPPPTESHLAEAAARAGEQEGSISWSSKVLSPSAVENVSYRFVATDTKSEAISSEWFELPICRWVSDETFVQLIDSLADSKLISGSVETLRLPSGQAVRARFALRVAANSAITALGERYHDINHRGRKIDARVYEHYKSQGERAYFPVPYAHVVPEDWSFWIRTTSATRFDFGSFDPERILIEVDLEPNQSAVEVSIFRGSPANCLREFLLQTGKPALPPEWTFGLWLSSNEWNTQERVEAELELARFHQIKADVVVIEAWSDESTFLVWRDAEFKPKSPSEKFKLDDFTFPSTGAWPNPKQMIEHMHADDTRLVLWQIPVLRERGSQGSQSQIDWDWAIVNDMVVKTPSGEPYRNRGFWFHGALLPDLSSQDVRDWWAERRSYLIDELGVDGFKTDGGEHAWGDDLVYANKQTGVSANNMFAVWYQQAYYEFMDRHGKHPLTFSRAGFTGASAFPCHWAGDEDSTWDAYRAAITAGVNAGASGIFFWGWDIAGFSGPIPDTELYLRSTAMAAFCPIFQLHSEFNHHKTPNVDRTPWNIAHRLGDASVLETFKGFADRRQRLRPYLAAEARYSVQNGVPLMRGLYFDFPHDPQALAARYEYLLGRSMLVAPVVEPGTDSQTVYLPAGQWLHAWTGQPIDGGRQVTVETPLNQIPVWVKADRADLLQHF